MSLNNDALDRWLSKLEQRSPESRIDLGLDRVQTMVDRLFADADWSHTHIITVGGTNGKGSTVAFCESMARSCGLSTAAYTSPHITLFEERLRLDGEMADSSVWLEALETVDSIRGELPLTWFEHVTLAALLISKHHQPDVMILEVGLGGRLDAVNVMTPNVSIITSIGLDHTDWLGPTRTHIGREKLGIARAGRPLIIGEADWPKDLEPALRDTGAQVIRLGKDFRIECTSPSNQSAWVLEKANGERWIMPPLHLTGTYQFQNAACALLALEALDLSLPLAEACLRQGLSKTRIAGRFERVQDSPTVILDVAHNEAGAQALAQSLSLDAATTHSFGKTWAVFSALSDKDIEGIGRAMAHVVDHWIVGGLSGLRGQSANEVTTRLIDCGITAPIDTVKSIPHALDRALEYAESIDRIVVFGSFQVLSTVRSRWTMQE